MNTTTIENKLTGLKSIMTLNTNDSIECLLKESCLPENLWIGENFHLNKNQIIELVNILEYWLKNEKLPWLEKKR